MGSPSSCWPPALQGSLQAWFSLLQRLWEAVRSSQAAVRPPPAQGGAWSGLRDGSEVPVRREKSGKSSSRRVLLLGQGGIQALAGPSWWPPWWRVGGHGSRGGRRTLQPSRELSALVYVPGIIKIPGTNSWLPQAGCVWDGVNAAGQKVLESRGGTAQLGGARGVLGLFLPWNPLMESWNDLGWKGP